MAIKFKGVDFIEFDSLGAPGLAGFETRECGNLSRRHRIQNHSGRCGK